ncbi:MAG TPA: Hsp20/alpha crystallin family protein [Nitrososphaeraceae archaeon]|jgi:HSP20 family protein|nr:Hsp20/alpha crystallin family protein [Nitrososphaeraceae archaeon]
MKNWDRQIERWMDICSCDEPDLMALELVREFDNLTKKFYSAFDDDLKETDYESNLSFGSEAYREEMEIAIIDDYSALSPSKEPRSKKIIKRVKPVPAEESVRITGIQKVGQDPSEDIIVTDKNIKLVSQLPINNKKEDIKVILNNDNSVTVFHLDYEGKRCMRTTLIVPYDINSDTARSTYRNGILEIIFDRK